MGYALAEAARDLGAQVTLVSGRADLPCPAGVTFVPAGSALDMMDRVMERLDESDLVIKAAAVADYRPAAPAEQKIKKKEERLTLELVRNPDILQAIGERKTHQFVIGFAAETGDLEANALEKLRRKRCDLLVANDVTRPGAGFGVDTNIVQIYDEGGLVEALPQLDKREVAERILRLAAGRMKPAGGDA